MRNFSAVCAVLVLAALTACATGQNVEGVQSASSCTSCHGGKDNQSGAPPLDAHGLSTSAAVGAHTTHVSAGVQCSACHVDPRVVPTNTTHQNGVADVIFGAIAQDPGSASTAVYNRATHTCSNVYCHSPSTAPGGALPTPAWGGTISGCTACHAGPAVVHGGGLVQTQCVLCHPTTVDATGAIVAGGGTHANGSVDAYQHDPGWAATSAKGVTPHGLAATYQNRAAFPTGLAGCRSCHGSNLDNPVAGIVPSCDACHQPYSLPGTSGADWRTDCTFCHGDRARAPAGVQLTDAAPPRDVLGNTLQGTSASIGAHQAHLFGDATNTPVISKGVACRDCHGGATGTLPTSFDPHVNGTIEVTPKRPFQDGAIGSYDPAAGTCSNVYCHGNLPRNPKAGNTPSWTATSGQSTCGTCHAANGAYCGAATPCTDTMTGTVGSFGPRHEAHRCARCHANSSTSAFSTQVGCFACHLGYQRQLGTTTLAPPVVNLDNHVSGDVEVIGTTVMSPKGTPFTLTLTYTAPTGSTPASCATNCHAIGGHAPAPAGTASW
jgi:predicted CxxxxCH...CXXCH cytochrome family protein